MKLDITSSAVEKGIDLAKDFLGKLISPAVEETGLLMKDKIASWRFENQIKILNKAKDYCLKHKISPKQVSFKLICPLLEYASLEEDEKLQDKWSILISNLVDSEQNIENHVFPYILSQMSLSEYEALEKSVLNKKSRVEKLNQEMETYKKEFPEKEKSIIAKIEEHKDEIYTEFHLELSDLKNIERELLNLISEQETLDDTNLKDFEISNLVRLGLIKNVIEHSVRAEPIHLPNNIEWESQLDVEVGINPEYDYYNLTELGELFICACIEKD
ncbi:hypothetical protein ABW636_22255 [Aquimarina sp. 2201CG1-2-11]|uniref:Abi-alpha family protein n=1 Tax=Aquimarina discodermiae TaxID=3231043 RepID=UPI003461B05D